jgi:hypothetical protein
VPLDNLAGAEIGALSKSLRKRKAAFSTEKDEKLRATIALVGDSSWTTVAEQLPGRSARQCREHWRLYLAPDVKNDAWSLEDEQRQLKRYFTFGPRWTMIAKGFPERTANNVKNKAKQLVRRMQKLYRPEEPGHIFPPGFGATLGEQPQ